MATSRNVGPAIALLPRIGEDAADNASNMRNAVAVIGERRGHAAEEHTPAVAERQLVLAEVRRLGDDADSISDVALSSSDKVQSVSP
jgi:hypothetical protein